MAKKSAVGVMNGNFRSGHYLQFSRDNDDLSRPTDEILQFLKANVDGEEYRRRFDEIYDTWRNVDYKRYMAELRAWRQEVADAQAERNKRGKDEALRIETGRLQWPPERR